MFSFPPLIVTKEITHDIGLAQVVHLPRSPKLPLCPYERGIVVWPGRFPEYAKQDYLKTLASAQEKI